jgi:spore coat protein U-like protein
MTRFVLAACCALLSLSAWAQQRGKPPAISCPLRPAECVVNAPQFNFGRGEMTSTAPPIDGHATVSVTCTRAPVSGLDVQVDFELKAMPPAPARQMRNRELHFLAYDMYLDPARTQFWGDGQTQGTFSLTGVLFLDDRNRVGTVAFPIYGRVHGSQPATLPGNWLGAVVTRADYTAVCTSGGGGGRGIRGGGVRGVRSGVR